VWWCLCVVGLDSSGGGGGGVVGGLGVMCVWVWVVGPDLNRLDRQT
jgi:hypothetical protein